MRNMKKVYYYESNPEPKIWERIVENVDGELKVQTPWRVSERFDAN